MSKQRVEGTEDVDGMENRETTATEDVPSSWGRQIALQSSITVLRSLRGGSLVSLFPTHRYDTTYTAEYQRKDNDNSPSGSLKRSRVTVRLFSSRGMFELLLWHERDNPNYSRIMSTVITY